MGKQLKEVIAEIFWLNASRIRLLKPLDQVKELMTTDLLWGILVNWTLNEKKEHGGTLDHLTKAMNANDDKLCHQILTKILSDNHVTPEDILPPKLEFPNPKDAHNFFLANRSIFQLLDKYVLE